MTVARLGERNVFAKMRRSSAQVAQVAAEEAKQRCEQGFRIRFGMEPSALKLGSAESPAKALLPGPLRILKALSEAQAASVHVISLTAKAARCDVAA